MTKQKTTIMDLRKDLTQIELEPQEKGMTSTKQRKKRQSSFETCKGSRKD